MFFKAALFFQIHCPADEVTKALRKAIPDNTFTPCEKMQAHSIGFIHPFQEDQLFYEQAGAFLFRLKIQTRPIPASTIAEMLEEKVKELEDSQGRKVYRKERITLKDEIVLELLPDAIPVSKYLMAYVDTKLNLIVFNTGSNAQAEKAMAFIREAIGSFRVQIPTVNHSPPLTMTKWLRGKPPKAFTVRSSCRLADPVDNGAVVTIKHDDLHSEAIQALLDEGKLVESLDLYWGQGRDKEQVGFTVTQAHILKGIYFSDKLLNQDDEEDELARSEADLALMADTFQGLITALGKGFGGFLEQEHMDFTGKE